MPIGIESPGEQVMTKSPRGGVRAVIKDKQQY